MAVIPGHIKNETVIIGCHRDGTCFSLAPSLVAYINIAWVMGAGDPTSGTVSLAEVVRGYGALLKSGWRPLRNILIASWDAEEVRSFSCWCGCLLLANSLVLVRSCRKHRMG